jgi:sugar lactone lactonase YvrE
MRGRSALAAVVLLVLSGCRSLVGGGARLDDRSGPPLLPASVLEVVADLPYPPGNVAVSPTGRVFFTYHPDGGAPVNVLELVDGQPRPYPPADAPGFRTVLSLRVDQQGRLWTLDHARYGLGQPRLLAFDLATDRVVHEYDFPSGVAGLLSMLNDFQVDSEGRWIYIAESSPILQRPAIIVYDTVTRTSRRLLHRHPSVRPRDYVLQAPGRDMYIYGLLPLRIGIDSIALDKRGEWLYYGPLTGDRMYRVATRDLNDETLGPEALAAKVEDFGPKPLSDGLTMDLADSIYITDPEHSAVLLLGPDRQLRTLVKDVRLRWPDGMSFGPDGWLYVTCSALHQVLFVREATARANAPFQIFRLQPGPSGVPGQ